MLFYAFAPATDWQVKYALLCQEMGRVADRLAILLPLDVRANVATFSPRADLPGSQTGAPRHFGRLRTSLRFFTGRVEFSVTRSTTG